MTRFGRWETTHTEIKKLDEEHFHLVELDEDLDCELRAEGAAGDHLVQRLGEAHADGGPPVQLEGGHGRPPAGSARTHAAIRSDPNTDGLR